MNKSMNGRLTSQTITADRSQFLRRVLWTDALASAASVVLVLVGAAWLEPLLGLPQIFLRNAALILIPFVALEIFTATRAPLSRELVWAVIAINLIWVIESVAVLFTREPNPTGFGYALIVVQALVVAVLAELEYLGLRRSWA